MPSIKDAFGDQPPSWTSGNRGQMELFSASAYPDDIPVQVCDLFEKLSLSVAGKGFARYSADAVLHQIRWTEHIERGNREFTINNNHSSILARWFLKRHPELPKFFELREKKNGD